jgi:hypothetical protein
MTSDSLPSDRSFGLTFAVILALAGLWLAWQASPYAPAAFGVAALFLLAALMRLAHLLNRIVSPLVMGLIYFGLLTPVAAVLRWRGRDVLRRTCDPAGESYWLKRDPPGPGGSGFPRQF